MYLKKVKDKKNGKTKLFVAQSYRNSNNTPTCRNIEYIGYLEDLIKDDPNAIDYYTSYAKSFENTVVNIPINLNDKNGTKKSPVNIGYFFLESIYKNIGIEKYITNYQNEQNFKYDLNKILQLLVYSRILNPASKFATFEMRNWFFEPFDVNLKDIYRSLSVLNNIKDDIQIIAHNNIKNQIGRNCTLVFYDVTNYYFETDIEDDTRLKGMSKENKKTPIVQMGLFIDSNGIPIAYKLFPGNTPDINTLIPIVKEFKTKYNIDKIIVTADKGLNSKDNLGFLVGNGNGYIVSQKVRGASKEFQKILLDKEGYKTNENNTFKIKSYIREREITDENKKIISVKEKVVCFWSKDFDDREKHKREKLEERLDAYLNNPSSYKTSNNYGIKKYLKEKHIDKETGEIDDLELALEFDKEKYEKDVSLDGYYAIITSEIDLSDTDIIKKYRGLWKIEESFKVVKSDLEGRPVYVRKNDSIEGHFLICYIALVISRILEYNLEHKYSIRKIQTALTNMMVSDKKQGIFEIANKSEVYKEIEKSFEVEKLLDYDYANISKIKKYRADIKRYKIKKKNIS